MSIDSSVHASVEHGKDAALVHAVKQECGSTETLVTQASDRIRRSQGKLFVTLVLIEQAHKASLSQRTHGSARVQQAR